jgi:hypothetical protein
MPVMVFVMMMLAVVRKLAMIAMVIHSWWSFLRSLVNSLQAVIMTAEGFADSSNSSNYLFRELRGRVARSCVVSFGGGCTSVKSEQRRSRVSQAQMINTAN